MDTLAFWLPLALLFFSALAGTALKRRARDHCCVFLPIILGPSRYCEQHADDKAADGDVEGRAVAPVKDVHRTERRQLLDVGRELRDLACADGNQGIPKDGQRESASEQLAIKAPLPVFADQPAVKDREQQTRRDATSDPPDH